MLSHREHWIDASQDRIVTEIARWADESIHRLKIALRQTVTAANFSSFFRRTEKELMEEGATL